MRISSKSLGSVVQCFPEITSIETNNGLPTLWSRKEIAAYYRVHISTVTRWEKAGLLPRAEKNFGHRLWSSKAVIRAMRLAETKVSRAVSVV
jgi:hypothetical protein